MTKIYQVWGIKRKSDGAKLSIIVKANTVEEALTNIASVSNVDILNAHTDESHSVDLDGPPHWYLIRDECTYSGCK